MTKEQVTEKLSGLRPWIIAYAVLWPPTCFFTTNWMISLGRWWLFAAIIPLAPILYFMIFFGLQRASPKFKITPQEMTLFIIINYLTGGSWWIMMGLHYWTLVPMINWNYAMFIHGKIVDPYKDVFLKKIPSYLAPGDIDQLNAFYYGGAFNWEVWLPSMIFWMVWSITLYVGAFFWGFFLRKPLIIEERMPFPGAQPGVYLLREFYSGDEKHNGLFGISTTKQKLFWAGCVFGGILVSPTVINAFLPSPYITYVQSWPFDLTPFTETILPGALFGGTLYFTDIWVAQWIPLDALATAVLYWFIFGVIYNVIAVRMGILPWTPGMTASSISNFASSQGFQWANFAGFTAIGLGIYMAWKIRRHIINIFKAGLGLDKSLPTEEEGVSYRTIVFGSLISMVILIMMGILMGGYAPLAIIAPFIYIIIFWGWTRGTAEQHFFPGHQYSGIVYDIGQFLGGYGPKPDPNAFNSVMMWQAWAGEGSRMSATTMHNHFYAYKIGHEMKTLASSILIVSIIVLVSSAVFGYLEWPWWYTIIGGYSSARSIEYHIWRLPIPWGLTYGTPTGLYAPEFTTEAWLYVLGGIIFVFLCYYLRSKFAWFFINPVGLLMLNQWYWATWLLALIIKLAVLKIGGARLHEMTVLSFSAGVLAGIGLVSIFGAWIMFFTIAVPEFIARMSMP